MIRINLLPFRAQRKKENIRRQISIFLLSLLLVAAAVIYFNIHLKSRITSLKADIDNTNQQLAKYEEINKEIAEIKRKLEILNKKIEVIKSLEANRKQPVDTLESMTQLIVPERMWFTSMTASGDSVGVNGIALDNQTVADFMTRLEASHVYGNVNLSAIRRHMIPGRNLELKSFGVNFTRAKPPASPDNQKASQ